MGERLDKQIALITGASRGIGRAVAVALAAEGAHVILVARTVADLEETDDLVRSVGGTATLTPLDITEGDSIDRLGGIIYERWGKLDILVGNAGVLGPLSPLSHVSPDAFSQTIEANLTANWQLIRSMETLLLQSQGGRAIFTTSDAAHKCRPYWGPYSVTKAALNALVKTWVHETRDTSLRINIISPGTVRTGMRAKAMPGEDPSSLPTAESITPLFVELAAPTCACHGLCITPEDYKTPQGLRRIHEGL
ncbi:MAG: SDR family NAD(P)-dependent oxidoreductase [Parvularculales bacterium]